MQKKLQQETIKQCFRYQIMPEPLSLQQATRKHGLYVRDWYDLSKTAHRNPTKVSQDFLHICMER